MFLDSNENTVSQSSFINVFQTETDRQPMKPNISEIRRRVEKLKRDRYNRTSEGTIDRETQFTITQPERRQEYEVKLTKGTEGLT